MPYEAVELAHKDAGAIVGAAELTAGEAWNASVLESDDALCHLGLRSRNWSRGRCDVGGRRQKQCEHCARKVEKHL